MIDLILVRTRGPRNVGLACRAAANFGVARLTLVAPETEGIIEHSDFLEMAHGVSDPASRIDVVEHLSDALAESTCSVGFTARVRQHRSVTFWDPAVQSRLRKEAAAARVALVFGNENDGLSGDETLLLTELVKIPTSSDQHSINLGSAVAIVLSALFGPEGSSSASRKHRPIAGAARERLKRHLQEVLPSRVRGESGRAALSAAIDRLFSQAEIETRDAQAWHKLLRELESHPREP